MLISDSTYLIFMIVLAAFIIAFSVYQERIKKSGKKYRFTFLFLLLFLPINWYTPTVYTITDCDEYTKEVLVFPIQKDGYKFEMGWYNYIINKSNEKLIFENIYYGLNEPKENEVDVEISPNSIKRINVVAINYLFTEPDQTVRTNSSGATKTALYCIY